MRPPLRPLLVACLAAALLVGAWATAAGPVREWRVVSGEVGRSSEALRLPDPAFGASASRGWQFVSAPLTPSGKRGALAVSDGHFWSLELRGLFRLEPATDPLVGLIFAYDRSDSYAALLWDTKQNELTLRSVTRGDAAEVTKVRVRPARRPWSALVLRVVGSDVAAYVDGEKVLAASLPSRLGRAAVFALGDTVRLDGLEVRALAPGNADADVLRRGRGEFETGCAGCHELNGPWNNRYAPDQWENVVNEMLDTEGASRTISRAQAGRIIDYLRVISLHPDPNYYRPAEPPE